MGGIGASTLVTQVMFFCLLHFYVISNDLSRVELINPVQGQKNTFTGR